MLKSTEFKIIKNATIKGLKNTFLDDLNLGFGSNLIKDKD